MVNWIESLSLISEFNENEAIIEAWIRVAIEVHRQIIYKYNLAVRNPIQVWFQALTVERFEYSI